MGCGCKNKQNQTPEQQAVQIQQAQAVKQQQEYLQIMHKGLRDALNNRTVEVDRLVEQAVDNKFNEQSATGGLGVLTGEQVIEEVVEWVMMT